MSEYIKIGKFKTQCLNILDQVQRTKKGVIITKHNKPIAQLVPFGDEDRALFGRMKGTIHFVGDIISPIDEVWDADR